MRLSTMTIGLLLSLMLLSGTTQAKEDDIKKGGSLPDFCPSGQGIDEKGECEKCPAGFFASDALDGIPRCFPCLPGQYSSGKGNTECSICPSNEMSAAFGQSKCIKCPSGSSAVQDSAFTAALLGASAILPTGAGLGANSCKNGATFALPPPKSTTVAITLSDGTASTMQAACPVPGTGLIGNKCSKCEAGSSSVYYSTNRLFIPDYFGVLCFPCGPGTYAKGSGNAKCTPCPAGHVAPSYLTSECSKCANGYVPNKADQPTAGTRANTLCVKANSRKMLEA